MLCICHLGICCLDGQVDGAEVDINHCLTTGSAPWDSCNTLLLLELLDLSALRCWRLLCGGGGLTPFAVEGSVGATVSVGFFCSRRSTLFFNFSGFRLL